MSQPKITLAKKQHISYNRTQHQTSHMTTSSNERKYNRSKTYLTNSVHVSKYERLNSSAIQTPSKIPTASGFRYPKLDHIQQTDITYCSTGNPIQQHRRKNLRNSVMSSVKSDSSLAIFLKKVEQKEYRFCELCKEDKYEQASQVFVVLINYAIDLNLGLQFALGLKMIAQFYLSTQKVNSAFFYFKESWQCASLLQKNALVIESLIGMAKCCSKGNLEKESIIFLKKALEYAWLYQEMELELLIYDQIGKNYYHMGDLEKAKKYHLRYINAIIQPPESALKMLSKQRMLKSEDINIQKRYKDLDILFLVHLKIPIKSFSELKPIKEGNMARKFININQKYHKQHQQIQQQVKKMLKNWLFKEQIQQPQLPSKDWTIPNKLKKFAFIDFKLNQTLKKYIKKDQSQYQNSAKKYQFKESLDQKVIRKLKQPTLDTNWYEKLVSQIKRDHKNKLLNVRNIVRVRGHNKATKPLIDTIMNLYNQFFLASV